MWRRCGGGVVCLVLSVVVMAVPAAALHCGDGLTDAGTEACPAATTTTGATTTTTALDESTTSTAEPATTTTTEPPPTTTTEPPPTTTTEPAVMMVSVEGLAPDGLGMLLALVSLACGLVSGSVLMGRR